MGEFRMPALGADMAEGTLTQWLVAPGDTVTKGQPVAVIETAKSDIEVECFESGTVTRLLVEPGRVMPVGAALAVIEPATAAASGPAPATPPLPVTASVPPPAAPSAPAPAGGPSPPPARAASHPPPEPVAASAHGELGPLARRLAAERGVDLSSVHGTGRGGRITRTDIERADRAPGIPCPQRGHGPRVRATPYARRLAAELHVDLASVHGTGENGAVRAADVHEAARTEHVHAAVPGRAVSASGDGRGAAAVTAAGGAADRGHRDRKGADVSEMRRAIAELMSRSKREIPHYYLSTTIDLAAATAWMRRHNRDHPVRERLVPAALLLRATALAVRRVPELNGFWQNGGFVPGDGVHLGVAVSLRDGGLLTPVIHDADRLRPLDLMTTLKDLVQRARRGRLRGTEVFGATLTVTDLGDQGTESVFGAIHPPQVALIGFGSVAERPWAEAGMLAVRPVVSVTLSGDHRATDGATGARLLTAIGRLLQKPEEL